MADQCMVTGEYVNLLQPVQHALPSYSYHIDGLYGRQLTALLLALIFNHLDDGTSLPYHKHIPHILSVNRRWCCIAIDLASL